MNGRVAGDELPGLRNRNMKIVGYIGQKSHNDEFGHISGEGTQGQP